jgi:hypothetical protein
MPSITPGAGPQLPSRSEPSLQLHSTSVANENPFYAAVPPSEVIPDTRAMRAQLWFRDLHSLGTIPTTFPDPCLLLSGLSHMLHSAWF